MKIEAEIVVAAPRPEVFGYLQQAELLPEYMTEFASVEPVEDGPPRVGAQYRYRMARGQAEGTFEWTKFVPSSHLAWSGPAVKAGLGSMQPAGWWDLSDAGQGTRVKLVMAPTPGGLFKLLAPFMAAGMRKENEQALQRLKDRLEGDDRTGWHALWTRCVVRGRMGRWFRLVRPDGELLAGSVRGTRADC